MHMSMCTGCEFEVILANKEKDEIDRYTRNITEAATRTWIKIELVFRNVSDTELILNISTRADLNVTNPFWTVDSHLKIFYGKGKIYFHAYKFHTA